MSPHLVHVLDVVEPKCMHHRLHGLKTVHGWKRFHGTIEKKQAEFMRHRVHGWKRVHGTIEKERVELAKLSACVTWDRCACVTEFRVGKDFMVRKEFMVGKEFTVQ